MKKQYFIRFLLGLALVALGMGLVGGAAVLAQGPEGVVITNPTEGETVSGIVVISGAVDFSDFLKYDFFLKNGGNEIWVATGYSPVINGNLLRLDTKTFADGTYQIMIRKVTSDSQYTDAEGPTFNIKNGLTAPNPFPEVETTFLYPAPGKATVRVRNCAGENFFMDYGSPDGFRSSGELTLQLKPDSAPICPYADLALIPGEYRGTAKGEAQVKGISYTLNAEAGKVYEMTYNGPAAGAAQLYIAEIKPDERVSTDTGGLAPEEPGRAQSPEAIKAVEPGSMAGPEATTAEPGETMTQEETTGSDTTMLPVSGQAAQPETPFIVAAAVLIALLVIGGVFAIRRGKQTA